MIEEGSISMALALCTGCGIGECIDSEKLAETAAEAIQGISCMKHSAACSEAGLAELNKLVQEKGVKRLAVAACSPRVKSVEFEFDGVQVERINLREQIAWVMEPGHEDTQMCAEDQTRMVLAKLDSIKEISPYIPEQLSSEILVLGGGIAGLNSAVEGARAGYRVHLVEQSDRLGGYAGRIFKMLPDGENKSTLKEPDLSTLVKEVEEQSGILVYLESTVQSISGEPGNFSVLLESKFSSELRVGAVVNATGWKPYNTEKLEPLGYGSDRVKTLEEFEQFVQEEKIPDRVLFILCAGSRDEKHLAYCSSYCCGAALKQALYVRELNPRAEVYIIYRDIRTTGFQEEFYKMVQADDAIFMTKGLIENVSDLGDSVQVIVSESLLDDRVTINSDMLVLATGMVPNASTDLQLQYRLGKGLPQLEYDFSDSHFICFPYETRRTGIFAAGTVRAPMDMEMSREDGAGAMLKAIQTVECVKRGEAVHPRAGDMSWPELYMERCTDCKRCTEECPFGSYDETEKGTPLPNPARCRRCGICVGSCPERVIGFADFNINSVSAMIKAVHVPDEFEEKPRILVFVCENDAYPALDAAGINRLQYSPFVRIIPVRCLGSINKVWISDALSHGYDGILQIGCKPGDDYQCHFIHGSELTEQRGENLQETLETMMLEPERIQTKFVEITEHHEIQGIINDYVEEMVLIGPNPFKDM
ncbi:MAG: hydrogenase iron-sulfur subunit [Bacteroidales bacterium]|nr:hydrogenase iron-sulfur subunit [Bacteroidales bacterium]